jgi:phage host-nuclease inhibitor protein Gam
MKTQRLTKSIRPAGAGYTRAQVEALATTLVAAQCEREALVAERDAAMLAAGAPYAPRLDRLDRELKTGLAILEAWAEANLAEFGKGESVTLAGHRVGWRLGNFAAKLRSKWTWAKVVEALQEGPRLVRERWLRTKVEPNKEAMIQDRETAPAELAQYGVEIVQERRFYLDPSREGQDDKTLRTEAA